MRTAAICPTCATYENAICVLYDGPYLPCTGISPLDSIAEALAKIDAAICALGGTTTTSTSTSTSTTSTTTTATPTTTTTTSVAPTTTTTTTVAPTTTTTTSVAPTTTTTSTSSTSTTSTSSTTTTTTTTVAPTTTTSTTSGPTTTTTTTTNCTTGLESHGFMTQIYDFEDNLINILTTPIDEACALLPAIQTGGGATAYTVYVESLEVGQNVIYSFCTPVATGTYALYDGALTSINTFIAVVDGVITEILNCGTYVTFIVNLGTDQATACDPELSTPTYLFAASGTSITGNTLYVDTALTDLAENVEFSYGPNYYTTNASGVVAFGGPC